MSIEIKSEFGHFLNEEQKKLKSEMMRELMTVFFKYLEICNEKLSPENVSTIISSILIMFNREILMGFLATPEMIKNKKSLLNEFFHMVENAIDLEIASLNKTNN